jgi:DNA-binding transcriptional regulator LsrR (DeoR family)
MKKNDDVYELALKVAHLYYYNQLTTEAIAQELKMSRPSVSKLLNFARQEGLVEIKIIDKNISINPLEKNILKRFKNLSQVKIVPATNNLDELEILHRVAQFTANEITSYFEKIKTCGLSWHKVLYEVSKYLTPKKLEELNFIATHGLFFSQKNNSYIQMLINFAQNYDCHYSLFPAPFYFEYPSTKNMFLQDSNIANLIDLQNSCEVYIFSISDIEHQIKAHPIIRESFISEDDLIFLKGMDVVGEISGIFYKKDGSYQNLPVNSRSSGIKLEVLKQAEHSICVLSNKRSVTALITALDAGFITDLIIDEVSAKELIKQIKG